MAAKSPRDDIARALKSINRAWEAVRNAQRAREMTAAAERTASAAAAVAQQSLLVDAEVYSKTGKIMALLDDDDNGDEVALSVDADSFAEATVEAADRLESHAHSWNVRAAEMERAARMGDEWISRRREEFGFVSKPAGDDDREMLTLEKRELAAKKDEVSSARSETEVLRSRARRAQSEAARRRHDAATARVASEADTEARRRLVAVREVESEARHDAEAAIAKARRRVMAAVLADDGGPSSEDRTSELLGCFADLLDSDAVRRLDPDRRR